MNPSDQSAVETNLKNTRTNPPHIWDDSTNQARPVKPGAEIQEFEKVAHENRSLGWEDDFEREIKPQIQACIAAAKRALDSIFGHSSYVTEDSVATLGIAFYEFLLGSDELQGLPNEIGNEKAEEVLMIVVKLAQEVLLHPPTSSSREYISKVRAIALLAGKLLVLVGEDILYEATSKANPVDDQESNPACDSLDEAWATFASDAVNNPPKPKDDSMADLNVGGHQANMPQRNSHFAGKSGVVAIGDNGDLTFITNDDLPKRPSSLPDNWPGPVKLKEFGEP